MPKGSGWVVVKFSRTTGRTLKRLGSVHSTREQAEQALEGWKSDPRFARYNEPPNGLMIKPVGSAATVGKIPKKTHTARLSDGTPVNVTVTDSRKGK